MQLVFRLLTTRLGSLAAPLRPPRVHLLHGAPPLPLEGQTVVDPPGLRVTLPWAGREAELRGEQVGTTGLMTGREGDEIQSSITERMQRSWWSCDYLVGVKVDAALDERSD